MSLRYYMDVHVNAAVTQALIENGIDVLTAQGAGTTRFEDPDLLDAAGKLGRVLVSQDTDFLIEGARRQRAGIDFAGIVYAHQMRIAIGKFINDLEILNKYLNAETMQNRVIHLPLAEAFVRSLCETERD
jgi:hypothetical protein